MLAVSKVDIIKKVDRIKKYSCYGQNKSRSDKIWSGIIEPRSYISQNYLSGMYQNKVV